MHHSTVTYFITTLIKWYHCALLIGIVLMRKKLFGCFSKVHFHKTPLFLNYSIGLLVGICFGIVLAIVLLIVCCCCVCTNVCAACCRPCCNRDDRPTKVMKKKSQQPKKKPSHRIMPGVEVSHISLIQFLEFFLLIREKYNNY